MFSLTLTLCLTAIAANPRDPAAYESVCRVVVASGYSQSLGTGTCVYSQSGPPESYVLTAAHVVAGTRKATCRFPDGKRYQATVIYNNRTQDVAVLRFAAARPNYTPLADTPPKRGDRITFVGYGGTRPYFLAYAGPRRGVVGSGYRMNDTFEAYVPQISQGDSGGPVLLNGKVCGVISAKDNYGNGIAPAVTYQTLTFFRPSLVGLGFGK